MSRVQIVQQKQPLSSCQKAKCLKIAAVILVQTVAMIASIIFGSGFFALISAMTLSLAMAIDLKEKKVVFATATTFSLLIATVSLAVLFPPSAPYMYSLLSLTTTATFLWSVKRLIN